MKRHRTGITGSIIIVNFDGERLLKECLDSLGRQSYRDGPVEILVIDNGSSDGSLEFVRRHHPDVALVVNAENNYAKALNLGISCSRGEFIAFLNNDMVAEEKWLAGLVELLQSDARIGCVGGKVLLMDGRINSVGLACGENFFFRDQGFGEEDQGQYDCIAPRDGITGGAVLWRRACLEDIGPVDEDYIMYVEDADLAFRCQAKGWRMMYTPDSVVHHHYQASSAGTDVCYYFCNRNRFLFLARHFPEQLPSALLTSHFYQNRQLKWLYESLPIAVKKLHEHHPQAALESILPELRTVLPEIFGKEKADHLFRWTEVARGLRRPSIGIYDHALHFAGGRQRYGCAVAHLLQHESDVTFIANKPVTLQTLKTWYDLDVSACRLKILPLPFFEERGGAAIESGAASVADSNPFRPIEEESGNYDIFINMNGAAAVSPKSPLSAFFCHFPDALRGRFFAADQYRSIVATSAYTAAWLEGLWGLSADAIIHPPVQLTGASIAKEDLILAVLEFEADSGQEQTEMIQAFRDLWKRHQQLMKGWRFILARRSLRQRRYRRKMTAFAQKMQALIHLTAVPIEIRENISADELKEIYARTKISWHPCGWNEREPYLLEDAAMTSVGAMQNGCVPLVLSSWQKEIVEHGRSGYCVDNVAELQEYTAKLIAQPLLLQQLSEGACRRGQDFYDSRFQQAITGFFDVLLEEYKTIKRPLVSEFLKRAGTQQDASPTFHPIDGLIVPRNEVASGSGGSLRGERVMADVQEIDVEQMMERIREGIRQRRGMGEGFTPAQSSAPPVDAQVAADLASLYSGHDIYHIDFPSHRRVFGPLVIFVKQVLRQLLTPILTRQVAYNAAVARVATHFQGQLAALSQHQAQLGAEGLLSQAPVLQALEARLTQIREELLTGQTQALQALEGRLMQALQDRRQ